MLTTVELSDSASMPQCTYSIHANDSNGPLVQYANIGDKIVHKWECTNDGCLHALI